MTAIINKDFIEDQVRICKAAGISEVVVFGKLDSSTLELNLDSLSSTKYLSREITKDGRTETISFAGVTIHVVDLEKSYSREDIEKTDWDGPHWSDHIADTDKLYN